MMRTRNIRSFSGCSSKALAKGMFPVGMWRGAALTVYRPYFGQFFHFTRYHPEKLPSAIERYKEEILRVFGVLDSVLAKQPWLVGNKMTIADLSFAV